MFTYDDALFTEGAELKVCYVVMRKAHWWSTPVRVSGIYWTEADAERAKPYSYSDREYRIAKMLADMRPVSLRDDIKNVNHGAYKWEAYPHVWCNGLDSNARACTPGPAEAIDCAECIAARPN